MSRPPEGEVTAPAEIAAPSKEPLIERFPRTDKFKINTLMSVIASYGAGLWQSGNTDGILFIGAPVTIYLIEKFIETVIDPKR